MIFRKSSIIGFFVCALTTFSCATEQTADDGTGAVIIDLSADTGFKTRSVNESAYSNVNNYKVRILNSSNELQNEYSYSDIPASIKLKNGSYRLLAFYGEDKVASRDAFYVEGSTDFNVEGSSQTLSVTCSPVCGKAVVKFDSSMSTYFSDYSVEYETKALKASGASALWAKGDTEPWYMKLDASGETVKAVISVTRKSDGKTSTVERSYRLNRNASWTLNISPKNENGNLGLTITIDESTNDQTVDIVVPSDWI